MSHETAIATAEPLQAATPAHLGRLILGSFRFSQGSPTLQTHNLEYGTHDLEFCEDDINEATELAEAQAAELLTRDHGGILRRDGDNRTDQELVLAEFNVLRPKLIMMIDPDDRTPRKDLLPVIRTTTLEKDSYYAGIGRRYVGTPDGRYFSYFVRYAMLGAHAGSAEYKDMFAALGGEVLDDAITAKYEKSDLNKAVAAHAQAHPADIGAIQAWWEEHVNWSLVLPDPA